MVRTVVSISAAFVFILASQALAAAPAECPANCPDTSKMVPIQAYGTTIFFDPVGRGYYHNGKKYAILNDKNEVVLVPADAPAGENVPANGPATSSPPVGQGGANPGPGGAVSGQGVAPGQGGVGGSPAPSGGAPGGQSPPAGAGQPGTANPSGTNPGSTGAPEAGTQAQTVATSQVASRSSSSLPAAAPAIVSDDSGKAESQTPLAKSAAGSAREVIPNLVAVKTPLADQPVNIANAADLARLNGRWRASVRDFLGNTTVIEMELLDLSGDATANVISQTTGQPPSESKRKVSFANNSLTLGEGADTQILGQISEASTVRLRINGTGGEMLFTRSPAD